MNYDISLCVTAGGRPDLLDATLESLLAHNRHCFSDFIVVNDFGDEATNLIVLKHLPQARLFSHETQRGHHVSIDEMYAAVTTPYIFHCEDDWLFDPVCFIPACFKVLLNDPSASQVTVRDPECQKVTLIFPEQVTYVAGDQIYQKSKTLSIRDWGHYTFNPSLLRRDLWASIGPFRKFYKERDVNDACLARGLTSARLLPGVCRHIGDGRHMHDTVRRKDIRTRLHRLYRSLMKRAERLTLSGS
jgi:glycosyltransferase involved in cell wall biosynthesis